MRSKHFTLLSLVFIVFVNKCCCELSHSLERYSAFYGVALAAEKVLKNSECKEHLQNVTRGIRKGEMWAVKLYDASGVPSTGLHWGHTFWLGSRGQCLNAFRTDYSNLNLDPMSPVRQPSAIPPFPVDYYVAYFRHHSNFQISVFWVNETKISLGLCFPSSCSERQISQSLQHYLDSDTFDYKFIYNTSMEVLEVKKTKNVFNTQDPVSILLNTVLVTIFTLVILGTYCDSKTRQSGDGQTSENSNRNGLKQNGMNRNGSIKTEINDNLYMKILIAFSFKKNFQNVFNMTPETTKLTAVYGLRTYTTIFIVVSHAILFVADFYENRVSAFDSINTYFGQILLNSSFSTDSFLCLSGFLMAYSFYNSKKVIEDDFKSLAVSYLSGIFKRVVRLSPSYIIVMLIAIVSLSWSHGADSLWLNERNDIICRNYWWTNMLYINNIYPGRNMCMYWTHYLALEMQFFVILTFFCHLSKRFFKLALTCLFTILAASILYTSYTAYVQNYKSFSTHFYRYIEIYYFPPWMRVGPYIIGIMYGYVYYRLDKKLEIEKMWISLIWTAVIGIIFYLMFGFKDRNMSIIWSILHTSCSRTIWAICTGWIILACATGHGGLINDVYSYKICIPFSRLTYSAYLINPIFSYMTGSLSDKSFSFGMFQMAINASSLVNFSFLFAIPLTCCVEMPFTEVYNIITEKISTNKKNAAKNDSINTEISGKPIEANNNYKSADTKFAQVEETVTKEAK